MIKLDEHELIIANTIHRLKKEARSHSPGIFTLLEKLPELHLSVDACFLSNPYATELFLRILSEEVLKTQKLRAFLEFYPSQNQAIAQNIAPFIGIEEKNIFVANGAIEIIQALMHRFVQKKVVVNIPTFSSYYEFATKDTKVLFYPLKKEEDFRLDTEHYIRFVKKHHPHTLILINQNNPCGGYLPKERLKELLASLYFVEHIILDLSFIHFAYEDEDLELVDLEGLFREFDNVTVLKSMSKDFGVAGLRVGYALMSEDKIRALLDNGYLWNVSGLGEYFLKRVMNEHFMRQYEIVRKDYIRQTQEFFTALKDLESLKIYPSRANFALVELLDGSRAEDFVAKMLIKYGIYVRTCKDKIGLDGEFVRIASRTREENQKILTALKDLFGK
ncbi:histidinol-phosphate transaminase [Campylobacter sp.]|uniref:pyridoxal phosphate-dependent aminotransferase n=1 Tax=Campylobacter sp. TaxID=205 RepID=UPI0026DC9EAB|nr:histidinol-phosphate transaminase [Campylobacter sp.]MDO4674676.1 histidinol-phosphate transaminase [Campylobacter sp.]